MSESQHKSLYEVAVIQGNGDQSQVLLIAPFPVMAVSKKSAEMSGVKAAIQLDPEVDVDTLGIIVRPFHNG
jgi:hypothetical protein